MIDEIEAQNPQANQNENQTQKRVVRNTGIYLIVQIISWCVTFVGLSIVPHALGEKAIGDLVLASSTVSMVYSFGSFCIDAFLVREVGRSASEAIVLIRATLGLRLITAFLLLPVAWLVLRLLNSSPGVMDDALWLSPSFVIGAVTEPMRSALAGLENARAVSLTDLLLSSGALVAVPFLAFGVHGLLVVGIALQIITLALRVSWLRGKVSLRPTFSLRLWGQLIRGGVPLMMNNYVGFFYGYITLLVLNHFLQSAAVGEYNQVARLTGTFLVVPTVISAALLPVLTRKADMDPRSFAQAKIRVLVVLIVSCLPIMTGVALLAEPLCHVLYRGKYVHVPQALQMGVLLLLPLYVINVIYQFLVAEKRNGIWSFVLLGTVILNTALAWFLVPYTEHRYHNGIAGATIANTIAEFAAMGFAFTLLKVNPFDPALLFKVLKGLVATAGMAGVMWMTRLWLIRLPLSYMLSNTLQLVVPALLGTGVFLALAGLLRAFPPQEQEMVVSAIQRKLRRAA
jgi:O-antigen/teichoic acid export membrane protein